MTSTAPGSPRPRRLHRLHRRLHRRIFATTATIALLGLAAACSGATSSDSSSGTSADTSSVQEVPAALGEADLGYSGADSAGDSAATSAATSTASRRPTGVDDVSGVAEQAPGDPRSLIRTGNVALRSDDVSTARFDVGKVLDVHGGEVAEESTQADDDGAAERVRLVLRVPVDEFDATMTDLQGVAELIDVSTTTQDVSTEVIDNEVRVELQRRSIDRISVLLDSAADLRDVIDIERELARREADLGSLEKRQLFLADQTAMATITLSIEPPREEREEPPVTDDEEGFLAGLSGGWTALKDVTTALLTVGGAVLPFALVLLVLAVPGRLVVRRLVARGTGASAAGPPSPTPAA